MAGEAYPVILRNDIPQGLLQWLDLVPNTSQRSLTKTAVGQTGYVNPDLAPGVDHIAVLADGDTTGGGFDVGVVQADEDGVVAYFRERIDADPGGANLSLSPAGAWRVASLLYDDIANGVDLTQANVEAYLTAVAGGPTDLDGATVGGSTSFGDMQELMRIASGQVYRTPQNCIVTTNSGAGSNFLGLAARNVLLAAAVPAQGTFYAQGEFLTACDQSLIACAWPASDDFVPFRQLWVSGALRASLGEGMLFEMGQLDYDMGEKFPDIRDPSGQHWACKHVLAALRHASNFYLRKRSSTEDRDGLRYLADRISLGRVEVVHPGLDRMVRSVADRYLRDG